jgi:hypothetical protein
LDTVFSNSTTSEINCTEKTTGKDVFRRKITKNLTVMLKFDKVIAQVWKFTTQVQASLGTAIIIKYTNVQNLNKEVSLEV